MAVTDIADDLVPRAEDAAKQHGLAQVIRVVVSHEQSLAQDSLAVAVRNLGEQVGGFVGYQLAHRLEIRPERPETLFPSFFVRRRSRARPITLGKIRGLVLWVARELEDVPLGDSQVLEDFPRRVLRAFEPRASQFGREILENCIEIRVSVPALEET